MKKGKDMLLGLAILAVLMIGPLLLERLERRVIPARPSTPDDEVT